MYTVYVIYNRIADKYYVGSTNDLERRIWEHNNHSAKKRFTRKYEGLWELRYTEIFDDKSAALKREKYIKSQKSKKYIVDLVGSVAQR